MHCRITFMLLLRICTYCTVTQQLKHSVKLDSGRQHCSNNIVLHTTDCTCNNSACVTFVLLKYVLWFHTCNLHYCVLFHVPGKQILKFHVHINHRFNGLSERIKDEYTNVFHENNVIIYTVYVRLVMQCFQVILTGVPWNIPQFSCFFAIYTQALRQVFMQTNYKRRLCI